MSEETQQNIMDRLVQAARVQGRWARMLNDNPTEAELAAAAEFVRDWMAKKKLSINNLAMKTGISRSVISQVLSGKYKGDSTGRLRDLLALIDHEAAADDVVRPDGLIETHATELMWGLIENVHVTKTIGVITAPAGFSKTTVLQAMHQVTKGSILIEIDEKHANANGVLRLLAEELKINVQMPAWRILNAIKKQLRGSGRLIMIDQAHELVKDAFNIIRTINDLGVAVVLAGTRTLRDHVNDTGEGAQFYSRVMATLPLEQHLVMGEGGPGGPSHSIEDVLKICQAGKVRFAADAQDFLFRLANHPSLGALRQCQLLVVAVMQAYPERTKPITERLLLNALRDLRGDAYEKFVHGEIDKMTLRRIAS